MSTLSRYSLNKPNRYSAKNSIKPVVFVCHATAAKAVYISGDFNDWDPRSHPMKQQIDGPWRIEVPLSHGHHHYHFVIDNKPTLDPRAQGIVRNGNGDKVSLMAVS